MDEKNNWEYYLSDCSLRDKKILSVLLENAKLHYQSQSNNVLKLEEILWLTKQGWLRSKLRKIISVQPMNAPCSMVFYFKKNDKNDRLVIDNGAVAAKTHKYSFSIFPKANFSNVQEIYADAIANDIDALIISNMPNRTNAECLLDATVSQDINFKAVYDYVVAPKKTIDVLKSRESFQGIDFYECLEILDQNTFTTIALVGKYDDSCMMTPVFMPYLLVNVGPLLHTGVCSLLMRYGMYVE